MTFLEIFRAELVAAGLARDPRVAGSGARPWPPPLFLELRDGAMAPGEEENDTEKDDGLVLTAYKAPGLSTGAWEGDTYRFDNVDLRVRCWRPPDAYDLEKAMRPLLHDRRNFDLGGAERIIEAMIFRELQTLGSGTQGFSFAVEYSFQRYV